MIRILEDYNDNVEVYENILKLIKDQKDPNITNVHSVDINKTRYGQLNVTFDYDINTEIMINIFNDNIQIIAPDNLYVRFKNIIALNYPEYKNIITKEGL